MNDLTKKQHRNLTKKPIVYLILIVLLAFGLRTIRAFQQTRYDSDAYLYFQMAKDWTKGGAGYAYHTGDISIPPLLPFAEACGSYIGLSPEITGLLLGGILGSLMSIAVFVIIMNILEDGKGVRQKAKGRKKCSDNIEKRIVNSESFKKEEYVQDRYQCVRYVIDNSLLALLGAFLVATHPFLIRISAGCMRESLYIPILTFAVMFAVIAIKNKTYLYWIFFGILVAVGSMGRTEGTEVLIAFLIWIFLELIVSIYKRKKILFYYISVLLLVIFSFLGVALTVQNILEKSGCLWSFTAFFERGESIMLPGSIK
jgi:hypothetical protein